MATTPPPPPPAPPAAEGPAHWLAVAEEELFGRVLPFWLDHSVDATHGGFFNCLGRDGTPFDTCKHVWLQGRHVWMFAKLFNALPSERFNALMAAHAGARGTVPATATSATASASGPHAALLDAAVAGARFLQAHVRAADGTFAFCLTRDGKPLEFQRKIFSACFYVLALGEVARATGDAAWRRDALSALDDVLKWVEDPTALGRPTPSGAPSRSSLAVPMILLNLLQELNVGGDAKYSALQRQCVSDIRRHIHHDRRLVLENVDSATGAYDATTPAGRLLNPGHAIECGWFLLEYATSVGDDALAAEAVQAMDYAWDAGLDKTHGGLLYFVDAEGHDPVQLEWNMKLWWPHCEAMIASVMAHEHRGGVEGSDRHWHRFVETAQYAFSHFSDRQHGEWYGYCDRRGDVTHTFKAGPYKGCFHVPRALFVVWQVLQRLVDATGAPSGTTSQDTVGTH